MPDHGHLEPLRVGGGHQRLLALGHDVAEVGRPKVEVHLGGVVRREREQVVDEVAQPYDVALDDRNALGDAVRHRTQAPSESISR